MEETVVAHTAPGSAEAVRSGDFAAGIVAHLKSSTRYKHSIDDRLVHRRRWREAREVIERGGVYQSPVKTEAHAISPRFKMAAGLIEFVLRSVGLYGAGERRALDIRRTDVRIHLPGLPKAFDGYRILHVSDVHLDAIPGLSDAIRAAVNGCTVDLCVFNGDYQSGFDQPFQPICRKVVEIASGINARDGRIALLGNHDCSSDVDHLEAADFQVLVNEALVIERDGQRLTLTGLDDPHFFYTPGTMEALRSAGPFGPDDFGIALVHSPEMATVAAQYGYGLYLCGHTHGGQVCLPGGKPLMTSVHSHRYLAARGIWRLQQMTGFTSYGAGVSGLPVRYFSHGEVSIITLVAATMSVSG